MAELTIPETPPVLTANPVPAQFRRCLHAAVFVGVWMAIGWLCHLDADSYLAAGVPLVIFFQLFVRKKPLVTLWIRDAEHFRLNAGGIILGLGLAMLPAVKLIRCCASASWPAHVPQIWWYAGCIFGAFGASFCFGNFTKQTWKDLGFCMGTGGVLAIISVLVASHSY